MSHEPSRHLSRKGGGGTVKIGNDHLTYSTLVHPGDTWDEMWNSVHHLPAEGEGARRARRAVRRVACGSSASSAQTLVGSDAERAPSCATSSPTTTCTSTRSTRSRTARSRASASRSRSTSRTGAPRSATQYTMNVADVLAEIAPEDLAPSIQSAPLGFKPRVTDASVVGELHRARADASPRTWSSSRRAAGAPSRSRSSPSRCASSRRRAETIAYFEGAPLLGRRGAAPRRGSRGLPLRERARRAAPSPRASSSTAAIRRSSTRTWRARWRSCATPGSRSSSSSRRRPCGCRRSTPEAVEALERYVDTVYLTQTFERRDGELTALHPPRGRDRGVPRGPERWSGSGACTSTSRFSSRSSGICAARGPRSPTSLAYHRVHDVSHQLEIETYTWDVLPAELKHGDIVEYVTRELEWVRDQLTGEADGRSGLVVAADGRVAPAAH